MRSLCGLFLSALLLVACGEDDATRNNDFVPLTAITIEPTDPIVAVGTQGRFKATGDFSGEYQRDLTAEVAWRVAPGDEGVLQFTATPGLADALAFGQADVIASLNGIDGTFEDFPVSNAAIQQLTVSPATASIAKGRQQQFTAEGLFGTVSPFSQDITPFVNWVAVTTEIASFNTPGLATGEQVGTTQITATFTNDFGTDSNTADLEVTPAVLDHVNATPATSTLAPGETVQLTAEAILSDGSKDTTATFTWDSTQKGVTTVSAGGLVTAVDSGSSTITASTGGKSGTATVTVATLQGIDVTATATSVGIDETLPLKATGVYSGNLTRDITTQVEWTSSPTNIATISASGVVTGKAIGDATITAKKGNITDTIAIRVTN